jgi:hypothetical protein
MAMLFRKQDVDDARARVDETPPRLRYDEIFSTVVRVWREAIEKRIRELIRCPVCDALMEDWYRLYRENDEAKILIEWWCVRCLGDRAVQADES